MTIRVVILGCGSSMGVPRIDGHWGQCDPHEPKNRRTRCSLLIEQWHDDPEQKTTILIDTAPDLREQLLRTGITRLDGVVYTHDHADQSHGIDDLRGLVIRQNRRIDVYMDSPTHATLTQRFPYCFHQAEGSSYPPILCPHHFEAGTPLTITGPGGDIVLIPFRQYHGEIDSIGFRFGHDQNHQYRGGCAYSSDSVGFPEDSIAALHDLDVWIVDALRYIAHPSHANLDLALSWIDLYRPRRAILTNMHVDLDYRELQTQLPDGVIPAFDGMAFTLPQND